ncbi:MAG: hypothetical protein IPP63_15650 [Chloracidobacterium sp.]|nr:hypothetical protein [Chloracidobacterium sp.]
MPIVDRFCDAVREFNGKKAIIVDLRGNTGGLLGPLYALSGMLTDDRIDIGTMIYKVGREPMIALSKRNNFTGKLVFLVDRYTISAGEIFAGAVQDNKRALIVGEKTAGEALPAISVVLPTGGVFLYPIANFKTKTGRLLEGVGVVPDVTVEVDRKTLLEGSDPQLSRAMAEIASAKLFPQAATTVNTDSELPPPPAPKPAPRVVVATGSGSGNGTGNGTGSGLSSSGPRPTTKGIDGARCRRRPSRRPQGPQSSRRHRSVRRCGRRTRQMASYQVVLHYGKSIRRLSRLDHQFCRPLIQTLSVGLLDRSVFTCSRRDPVDLCRT